MIRLQVKTSTGTAPALRFPTWSVGMKNYAGRVDWFAFHSLHHGITAFLKPEEAGTYPTLRYDGDNDPAQKITSARYAEDYPLERVIKELLS